MIDTISGAKASAIWYSLAETAKANNLKPYEYLDLSYLDDLLPWSDKLPDTCRKKEQKPAEETVEKQ